MSTRPGNKRHQAPARRRRSAARPEPAAADTAPPRATGGRFAPGVSGNPNGRPKVAAAIRELAREHGHAAIDRLVQLMNSKDEMVSLHAARALLDRGYGRPEQAIAVSPGAAFAEGAVTVTTQVEAAAVYARLMRGDLPLEAVRFEPTGLPAPAEASPGATIAPMAARAAPGAAVRPSRSAGADTGHRGAPGSVLDAAAPAAPAKAGAHGGS